MAAAFSLTPGTALQGVIDFSARIGTIFWGSATAPNTPDLYDVDPDEFHTFINNVDSKASEMGWDAMEDGILSIPDNPNARGALDDKQYLIRNYGTTSLEHIRACEAVYIQDQTREAQNTRILYQYLWNMLSTVGRKKVSVWSEQYEIDGFVSGNLLLRVIIREGYVDSNGTASVIRTRIGELHLYIHKINCNITKFNAYVMLLVESLAARGQTSSDLLVNIFKAYVSVKDGQFSDYMKRKQEDYDDSKTLRNPDTAPQELMNSGATKYKQLVDKDEWEAPSPEEEKILALNTKIDKLKTRYDRLKEKKQKVIPKKKQQKERRKHAKRPEWLQKNKKPKDMHSTIDWNGAKWYWCCKETGGKCYGNWRSHKPAECKGTARKPGDKPRDNHRQSKPNKDTKDKRVVIDKALQTTIDPYNDDGFVSDDNMSI